MIRINDLIKDLQKFEKEHGNVLVLNQEEGYGGRAVYTSGGIGESLDKINSNDFDDENLDENLIKELFPKWDGDIDSLYEDGLESIECVTLHSGSLIYTT